MCLHSNPITNVVRKVRFPKTSKKQAKLAYAPLNYEIETDPWSDQRLSLLEMTSFQIKKFLKNESHNTRRHQRIA